MKKVAYFSLRFNKDGVSTESESFEDEDAFRAILLAQDHQEPAELWKDGKYLTTIYKKLGCGTWQLVQDRDFLATLIAGK